MAEKIATRHAYGEAFAEIGANPRIVGLDADVATCTMSILFGRKYPDRFFNVGIAEANMIGMAAGMATFGMIPFVHAFAMFAAGRGYDQIRNTVCYPRLNVKVVGTHAGLTVGEDGATHQCLEDLALMRAIPGMTVICPADSEETRQAVRAMVEYIGPVYLRLGRLAVETVSSFPGYRFEIGKAVTLREGEDVAIIATGIMVQEAIKAADMLKAEGFRARVLNMHTIKPLDEEAVIRAARETGAIVTAEEHNMLGGLGGAVAEVVSGSFPVPVLRVGTRDTYGRSGDAILLLKAYGLSAEEIVNQCTAAIALKKTCDKYVHNPLVGEAGQAASGDMFAWLRDLLMWGVRMAEKDEAVCATLHDKLLTRLDAELPNDAVPLVGPMGCFRAVLVGSNGLGREFLLSINDLKTAGVSAP